MDRKIQSDVSITTPVQVVIQQGKEEKTPQIFWTHDRIADGIKWLIGTVFLGLLGWYTNYQVKETELEVQNRIKDKELVLQRMEIDSKLVTAVSAKFDTGKIVQLSYLNFIQPFISTDSIKVAVRRQIEALGNEIESQVADSINKVQPVVVSEAMAQLSASEKEGLQKLANRVPSTPRPISEYKKADDSTMQKLHSKGIDSVTLNIQQTKVLSTPRIDYNYILQRSPETKWCKKGYYVEFNNTLRIGINDLSRSQIEINVKRLKGDDAELIQKEPIILKNRSSIQIDDGDLRYKISLDYIGSAGRNPFTIAGYITVASYKK